VASALVILGFLASAASGAPETGTGWAVSQADVRFTLKLTGGPTHGSAGYFFHLPDGGALPGPVPAPRAVVPGTGDKLETRVLWHDKAGGLWGVFADPGKGTKRVHVYVSGATKAPLWSPETSELRPGAILCVSPGKADMTECRKLARLGEAGPAVHVRNKAGIARAPLSIGGDDTGRPKPASFYLLGYLDVTDPGKTWIAPFVIGGECEVRIDGKKLNPKKRIEKWGGTGAYFDLERGLHRLEVFQTAPGSGPYSTHPRKGGLMYLTWRTPKATMAELGGVRSKKVPMSGTSRMETRVLRNKEIVRSGRCEIEAVSGRGGRPVACVLATPAQTFWVGAEQPLIVYELRALTSGQPAGASYGWEFAGGARAGGESVMWLFPGFREIRAAMTAMLEASPADPDPVAKWGQAYWNNLIRTAEPGAGYELLRNLFTVRAALVAQRLSPDQLAMLQDLFLDIQEHRDPKVAVKLIDSFHTAATDTKRRGELMIRKAEDLMFYLDDRAAAARGLAKFAEGEGELAEWARIRLGDIAFLDGDLNKATSYYADVQGRARLRRNRLDGLVSEKLIGGKGAAKTAKTGKRGGNPRPLQQSAAKSGSAAAQTDVLPENASNWRFGALRDVSNSENVVKLIDGGFLLEAGGALRKWEREYPMSKIGGDLLLVEAKYRMKLGDLKRARVMLEAYCREIDASAFLPDAVRMLVECAKRMKAPPAEILEVVEKVRTRLKYHPVSKELEEFLSASKGTSG